MLQLLQFFNKKINTNFGETEYNPIYLMIKYLFLFTLLFIFINSTFAQDSTQTKKEDDWKMRTYYMVFLKSNPDHGMTDKDKINEIQSAHLANIEKLFYEGKLVLAGPFMDK